VPRIIAYGRYVRPTLGITANDDVSRQLFGAEGAGGVLVLDVTSGSPAERAGLRPTEIEPNGNILLGDIIAAIDGRPVDSFNSLINMLDAREFGDRVTLTVIRGERRVEVPITLGTAAASRTR
jgi:S1-C subfamily serine protease